LRVATTRSTLSEVLARRHLPALDGLRAVAVGLVIFAHAAEGRWFIPGDLGVSTFFVLSGFLITWLLLAEFDSTGAISLRGFYLRRTLRIFPAYYTFLVLSYMADWVLDARWPLGLTLSALTYTVNYYNALTHTHAGTIAHAWSLAVEEQFYLLWPLGFSLLVRFGRRVLARTLAASIVLVLGWRSWLYLSGLGDAAYVYNAFDTRFDNLAVGCLLAVTASTRPVQQGAALVARYGWMPLVTVLLVAWSRLNGWQDYHYSVGFTVNAVLLAVLVVQLMQLSAHPLWRWLGHPTARFLGAISYPLYLYHEWGASVGRHLRVLPPSLQAVAGLLACIGLASGSYYVVERPFLALKRRWEGRAAGRAAPTGAAV
jgi:peptidoglycan/LPS O-acetylase OafA/YrhL